MNKSSFRRAFYIIICSISLYSCASFPVDSEGTLDRARGDELVVGISENKPWTQTSGTGRYSGIEVDLIEGFADTIDADVQWLHAPESVLAEKIKNGQLDLMIGGYLLHLLGLLIWHCLAHTTNSMEKKKSWGSG